MSDKQGPLNIDRLLESINQYSRLKGRNGFSAGEKPVEIFRTDLISAMQLPDTEALQSDLFWPLQDNWRIEWEKGVQVPVEIDKARKPKAVHCRQIEPKSEYKHTNKLFHITQDEWFSDTHHEVNAVVSMDEECCRYDLDEQDTAWLQVLNEQRLSSGETAIDELTMERIMEALETQCHENMTAALQSADGCGIEFDEHIVCDVCRALESEDGNEMVFCDGCDLCVHQACYGIDQIPEGTWLCRTCARGLPPPLCLLCPKRGGAMKCTRSGLKWAHVSCALWIPEVSIGEPEKMEPVTKISEIPPSRWALVCSLCREKEGACIQCCVRTCKTAFHVTCAFDHGLVMKTLFAGEEHQHIVLNAYCARHSRSECPAEYEKLQTTPRKRIIKQEKTDGGQDRAREIESEFYKHVDPASIASLLNLTQETVKVVYFYWKLKRRVQRNKALLLPRAAQAELLSQLQEDGILARMKMFVRLRQDLERVRNLCYMVVRREKTKRFLMRTRRKLFDSLDRAVNEARMTEREVTNIQNNSESTVYDTPDVHIRNAEALDLQMEQERQEDLRLLEEEEPQLHRAQRKRKQDSIEQPSSKRKIRSLVERLANTPGSGRSSPLLTARGRSSERNKAKTIVNKGASRNSLASCSEAKSMRDSPVPDTSISSSITSFLQPEPHAALNDTAKEYLASFKQFVSKSPRQNIRGKQKPKSPKKSSSPESLVSSEPTASLSDSSPVGRRLRERANRNIQKVKYTRGFVEVNGLKTLPENKLDEYIETLTCTVMAPAESVKLNRRQATLSKAFETHETKSERSTGSHHRPVATAS